MCVGGAGVFVVEVLYEPPKSRGICVEGDGGKGVFPDGSLLCSDIICNFCVECL